MTSTKLPPLAFLAALAFALPARAEQIVLAPRYQPGDTYQLSLAATTDTESMSRGATPRAASEDVALRYEAIVLVLEVDGEGRATRERHLRVALTATRPDHGERSLFRPGASFELRRERDGEPRLFVADRRLDRELEKVVAGVLASRLEDTRLAALLDPGRPVEVGETWTLDPALARRILRERGLRVVEFGAPATARLERDADGALVLRYAVPVSWLELRRMPPNTRAARSEGRLAGEVRLAADPRGDAHSSSLAVAMNGAVVKTGVAPAFPWRLASTQRTEQQARLLERALVSGL
jgi:hypothetical protein